jgi:hypothetical protein
MQARHDYQTTTDLLRFIPLRLKPNALGVLFWTAEISWQGVLEWCKYSRLTHNVRGINLIKRLGVASRSCF